MNCFIQTNSPTSHNKFKVQQHRSNMTRAKGGRPGSILLPGKYAEKISRTEHVLGIAEDGTPQTSAVSCEMNAPFLTLLARLPVFFSSLIHSVPRLLFLLSQVVKYGYKCTALGCNHVQMQGEKLNSAHFTAHCLKCPYLSQVRPLTPPRIFFSSSKKKN